MVFIHSYDRELRTRRIWFDLRFETGYARQPLTRSSIKTETQQVQTQDPFKVDMEYGGQEWAMGLEEYYILHTTSPR